MGRFLVVEFAFPAGAGWHSDGENMGSVGSISGIQIPRPSILTTQLARE